MLEEIQVSITGEPDVFTAYVDRNVRWNGWLASPYFDRANADRVVAWINGLNIYNGVPVTLAEWAEDVLFITDNLGDGDLETTTRYAPDDDGRYPIGAFAWCWYKHGTDDTDEVDA